MSTNAWDWSAPSPARSRRGRVVSGSMGSRSAKELAYDQLAQRFAECFRTSDAAGLERLWSALDRARAGIVAAGVLTADQAATASRWLLADLTHMAGVRRTMPLVAHAAALRDGAAASIGTVVSTSDAWLHGLGAIAPGNARRLVGEVTCAGTVTCRGCGRQQRLERSTFLTPCPGCNGEVYNRAAAG